MMKKSIYIVIIVTISILSYGCWNQCVSNMQKGTAKWWASNSSEESKERGVFISYYEALPFEYEDSIFYMKLVFKEVYTEWEHWFEWKDTALTNCQFWKNSETVKDQHLIGIFESSCVLGIKDYYIYDKDKYIINDSCFSYSKLSDCICLDHSKMYRGEWKALLKNGEEIDPLFYWEFYGAKIPYFYISRYKYDMRRTGTSSTEGEFRDTIKIPITSSFYYDEKCGYDHAMHFPFGELVFIRKK